jgi:ABC-type Fe3+/spermidine/putrescine transport system ATPase subunit
VADFVGSANQLEGDVVAREDAARVRVRLRSLGTEVSCYAPPEISSDDAVVVIARPEGTELVEPGDSGAQAVGQVIDVSYLGPQAVYTIDTATGQRILATRQGWEPTAYRPGDTAAVRWSPEQSWVVRL